MKSYTNRTATGHHYVGGSRSNFLDSWVLMYRDIVRLERWGVDAYGLDRMTHACKGPRKDALNGQAFSSG